MPRYRRFSETSVSERLLDSMFLITIGLAYIFAMVHIYYSHQGRDGEAGLSIKDIEIAYYGKSHQTRLGAALNGPMSGNLDSPEQKKVIEQWLNSDQDKTTFENNIAPILNNNCIACHSTTSELGLPPLTTFDEVKKLTHIDTGASIQSLVRISHIHMFGIAFILFFVGRIFILCEMTPWIKRVVVVVPFVAMLIDIFSWYITKFIPEFSYIVVLSGALMGLSLAVQIITSLYQMWWIKGENHA